MPTQYPENIDQDLMNSRGYLCEWCRSRYWTEKHHALIRRDKRFPELNAEINLMAVCHQCHMSGQVDGFLIQRFFYFVQQARGYPVEDWISALAIRIKPDFRRYSCTPETFRLDLPLRVLFQELSID